MSPRITLDGSRIHDIPSFYDEINRAFLQAKLALPGRYDLARIRRELDALEAGTGQTFFDTVLEIIAAHPNITLDPHCAGRRWLPASGP